MDSVSLYLGSVGVACKPAVADLLFIAGKPNQNLRQISSWTPEQDAINNVLHRQQVSLPCDTSTVTCDAVQCMDWQNIAVTAVDGNRVALPGIASVVSFVLVSLCIQLQLTRKPSVSIQYSLEK